MFLNAAALFNQAVTVCEQITCPPSTERYAGRREALVSILFATIAAEAFINELGVLAGSAIPALHEILDLAETSRTSIEAKYQLARFVLTGSVFDRGSAPFQNFYRLIKLRNAIVHAHPQAEVQVDSKGRTIPAETEITTLLRDTGAVASQETLAQQHQTTGPIITDWLDRISTKELARWACNSTAAIVQAILASLPQHPFVEMATQCYRDNFREIGP